MKNLIPSNPKLNTLTEKGLAGLMVCLLLISYSRPANAETQQQCIDRASSAERKCNWRITFTKQNIMKVIEDIGRARLDGATNANVRNGAMRSQSERLSVCKFQFDSDYLKCKELNP